MRVVRRRLLVSAAATLAAPALARLASADAPQVTLKLHHFFSSVSSGHDKFLAPWARKVETESGGRIRIDIFPSMQLGGAPAQLFDQVRDGTVDIAWVAPSLTPGRFPKTETFELPFVPSRRALVSSKAIEDFAAANLKDEFADVHPVCFACTDRGVIHATRPVRTVEDVKELSLHVPTRLAGEAMRVVGARAVPMPIAQLPVAITQHVVDGCVDPWHVVPALRLNDLLRMHTEFSDFSLSTTTLVLMMNSAVYDHLPRDLKSVVDSNSGQLAAGMAGAMWDLQAAAVSDMVVQRGDAIVTLLPEAVAHWRKAVEPAVAAWLKDMKERKVDGGRLLANAQASLAKFAREPEPQAAQMPPRQDSSETAPRPEVKVEPKTEAVTPPKPEAAVARPPAVKPAPPPVATVQPAMQPPAPASHSTATTAASPPHVAPPPAPSMTVPPTPPAPSPTPPIAPPSAPVATATPTPAPVPKPPVAAPSPPKTLDIPL